MILLVAAVPSDLPVVPQLGRLVIPRLTTDLDATERSGMPWAADNDGFGGFGRAQAVRYEVMCERIAGRDGLRWVTSPDVVGDHAATLELFGQYQPCLAEWGLPAAFVLQNGVTPEAVPWEDCAAVFIGGDDAFKLGPEARACVAEAHHRGHQVHMGRVNSLRRMRYAAELRCHSVDGTKFSRWRGTHLVNGLRWMQLAVAQSSLLTEETA